MGGGGGGGLLMFETRESEKALRQHDATSCAQTSQKAKKELVFLMKVRRFIIRVP